MTLTRQLLLLSFLLVFIFTATGQDMTVLPGKIVFKQAEFIDSAITSRKDVKNRINTDMKNSLKASMESIEEKVLAENLVDMVMETEPYLISQEREIVIECSKDSIWRSTWIKNQMQGDWERISKDGHLFRHIKADRRLCYDTLELQVDTGRYSIVTYRNLKKAILGYDCYKITITKENSSEESLPFKAGKSHYTLYVTESIALPLQAVQFLPFRINGFPLEITTTEDHLPGYSVVSRAILIER